jgi:CBS domain-containing protein
MLLVALGLVLLLNGGTFNGIYLAILGWLLASQARGVALQTAFTERIEGVTVAEIMDPEPVTIPAGTTALRAYEDFFLRYGGGYEWFAVIDADGRYVGRAMIGPVREAAEGGRPELPVADVIDPADAGSVLTDATLETLLTSEPLRRLGALMAVDGDGRLRGVVTAEQVARALRARLVPGAS